MSVQVWTLKPFRPAPLLPRVSEHSRPLAYGVAASSSAQPLLQGSRLPAVPSPYSSDPGVYWAVGWMLEAGAGVGQHLTLQTGHFCFLGPWAMGTSWRRSVSSDGTMLLLIALCFFLFSSPRYHLFSLISFFLTSVQVSCPHFLLTLIFLPS